jgi:ElaB/YqjD/DUF883 family membrane-anchored ribosome-binding protein
MSYADAASKGPAQPDAEKVPAPVPEIAHDDSDVHSIDSLNDSLHIVGGVNSIPSYADQQRTEEEAAKAKRATEQTANRVSNEAQDFKNKAESSAKQLGKDADKGLSKTADKVENAASEAESSAKQLGKDADKNLSQAADKAEKDLSKAKDTASKKYSEAKDVASEKYSEAKDVASKEYSKAKKELGAGADKAEQKAKKAEQWAEKNKGNPVVIGNAVAISALAGFLGIGAYRLHKANALTWEVAGTWAGVVGLFAVGDYFVSQ